MRAHRLNSLQDAATMSILCSDKTGTITANQVGPLLPRLSSFVVATGSSKRPAVCVWSAALKTGLVV